MYFSSDFQRSNCWYFVVNIDVFWNACVFASVYFWCFFGKVEGRKEVRGESKDLKTMEILLRNEHFWFPMFFKGCPFVEKVWTSMIFEVHLAATRQWNHWFHEIPASVWFMLEIWSGRFGCSHVMVSVICKVAQRRPFPSSGWVIWGPEVHCGGKGVNKQGRKWVLARDLTRHGPEALQFFY